MKKRSNSAATIKIDFQKWLGARGVFDESSVQVVPADKKDRVPHRLDRLFGSSVFTLNFVLPDEKCTEVAVYFDTSDSRRSGRAQYGGLVGDGDRFCQEFGRREIAPSHFDCFIDFDGDGDLDLFRGGVEPFVYCFENVGRNRLFDRGRLASAGEVLKLPCSRDNRSWVTVAFYDVDGDGDQDFVPSFGDGPDAGKFVLYRNISESQVPQLAFERLGILQTMSGVALAGGEQAGGWFPSITFVRDWDRDGKGPDALVGSNHRCWLYRNVAISSNGMPLFAEPSAVQAGGSNIVVVNPRFAVGDIDADGDLDLFAGSQPGAVHWFENIGTLGQAQFAAGKTIAWTGKYLIGDAHSGVAVADFDNDHRLDLATGRFWERADLNAPNAPRDFGGYYKYNSRFTRDHRNAPYTEQFQLCDAVRQNSLRVVDWDADGKLDLLAGDTDGFIWLFRNHGQGAWSLFARGERLRADGEPLSVAATGGHARLAVCDWNGDGLADLVVADASGTVTLFLRKNKRSLAAGERLSAAGKPLQFGGRASVLVCDWDSDGAQDLIAADEKGYYLCRNLGSGGAPVLAEPRPILFSGRKVSYVRPNLGSFVDWDGDGKKDLVACHFENTIRFYRNIGSGAPGEEPKFADPEGIVIVRGESPQMISGADVVDWNQDGDLDIVTGQGHGGSGLRFYERDWIEDQLHETHPAVVVKRWEASGRR